MKRGVEESYFDGGGAPCWIGHVPWRTVLVAIGHVSAIGSQADLRSEVTQSDPLLAFDESTRLTSATERSLNPSIGPELGPR